MGICLKKKQHTLGHPQKLVSPKYSYQKKKAAHNKAPKYSYKKKRKRREQKKIANKGRKKKEVP